MKRQFLALVLCSCAGALHADVMFQTGDHPKRGQVNVLTIKGETGTTVTGRINEFPAITVDFTSTETLLTNANGQAQVTGCAAPCTAPFSETPIDNMTISLAGGLTFGDLIFDPHITNDCHTCGGTATVTVDALDSMGHPETFTFTYALSKGENFAALTTTMGEKITSVNITDSGAFNFSDMRQVRLSELPGIPTPEPSTYAPLTALALGAIALVGRSKKKV